MLVFVIFDLVLYCDVIVFSPCSLRWHNNLHEPVDSFRVASEKKTARVEINISLGGDSSPRFISDIAVFVLKRDGKLQLNNYFVVLD